MADYIEKEPERKKKEQEKIQKKIKEGLKPVVKTEIRIVEDPKFIEKRQNVLDVIDDAVSVGLKNGSKKKAPAKPWANDQDSD